MYKAYITQLKNIKKHSNADRLQVAEIFGTQVIVSLEAKENQLGIYFPTDGKLGQRFAEENNLLRKKDEFGNEIGGYLDPEKRHIRALNLRGEKSDGLWLPIESLSNFTNITKLKAGDTVDVLNSELICEKYVPKVKTRNNRIISQSKKKVKVHRFPTFQEHKDTEQLMYNLKNFKKGDIIYLSLKVHGTSQRTGYLPEVKQRTFFQKLFKIEPKTKYK